MFARIYMIKKARNERTKYIQEKHQINTLRYTYFCFMPICLFSKNWFLSKRKKNRRARHTKYQHLLNDSRCWSIYKSKDHRTKPNQRCHSPALPLLSHIIQIFSLARLTRFTAWISNAKLTHNIFFFFSKRQYFFFFLSF